MSPLLSFVFFALLSYVRYFVLAESDTGKVLPPQNLSLVWLTDFDLILSWTPPKHSMTNCTYETKNHDKRRNSCPCPVPFWEFFTVMEGGLLNLSVQTICNGRSSEPADLRVSYPEMVKNVQCYVYSHKDARCSWVSTTPTPVVRFYYRLSNENFSRSVNDDSPAPPLQECSTYICDNGRRSCCDLQANIIQAVQIVFNGTANKTFFRNTFERDLIHDVRPPALEWTVKKSGDKFNISWTPPAVKNSFKYYLINYTECKKNLTLDIKDIGNTSTQLKVVPHCQYMMTIESVHDGFKTPPSDKKHFDAETDPNALMYAAAVIPLVLAVLVVVILVFCRRNKECFFPKVPRPRDLLSDISDNTKRKLHIPVKEEVENCDIILVTDSRTR